jgi:hypothetical protein
VTFDPWAKLFQNGFVQRAQALLTGMFRVATDEIVPAVKAASSAAADGGDTCSDLGGLLWNGSTRDTTDLVRHRKVKGWGGLPFIEELSLHTGGYTRGVVDVADAIDAKLRRILAEALVLLGPDEGAAGAAAGAVGGGLTSSLGALGAAARTNTNLPAPFDKYSDAIEMRRFLQASCEQYVKDFAEEVASERRGEAADDCSSAAGGQEGGGGRAGAAAVDSASKHGRAGSASPQTSKLLYLGRLCKAVAERCGTIDRLIMLPAASDRLKRARLAKTYRRSNFRPRTQLTEHDKRLAEVKAKLVGECTACQLVWAASTADALQPRFYSRVLAEDWLQMFAGKRVWQQHTIDEESEAGGKVKSMILLPSQPSPFVMNFLCGLSAEVNVAGGHAIGRAVMAALAKRTFGGVAAAYAALLDAADADADADGGGGGGGGGGGSGSGGDNAIGSEGFVQILFDVYFLADVLVGPATAAAADSASALAAAALVERVRGHMDPFDLDVFTPLLQTGRAKAYHRSAVLLGFFTQLNPAHAGNRPVLLSSESHNTVAISDVAARFPLLPLGSTSGRVGGQRSGSVRTTLANPVGRGSSSATAARTIYAI